MVIKTIFYVVFYLAIQHTAIPAPCCPHDFGPNNRFAKCHLAEIRSDTLYKSKIFELYSDAVSFSQSVKYLENAFSVTIEEIEIK